MMPSMDSPVSGGHQEVIRDDLRSYDLQTLPRFA